MKNVRAYAISSYFKKDIYKNATSIEFFFWIFEPILTKRIL